MNKRVFFLSFFGAGLSRYAPGTVATVVAIVVGVPILLYLGAATLFLLAAFLTAVSIKEINRYEEEGGEHDDPRIVVDEVVGTFLALSMTASMPLIYQIPFVFLFFRFLDIKKPSFIGLAERKLTGGNGVMWDDILAGFFAGILSWAAYKVVLVFDLSF